MTKCAPTLLHLSHHNIFISVQTLGCEIERLPFFLIADFTISLFLRRSYDANMSAPPFCLTAYITIFLSLLRYYDVNWRVSPFCLTSAITISLSSWKSDDANLIAPPFYLTTAITISLCILRFFYCTPEPKPIPNPSCNPFYMKVLWCELERTFILPYRRH